MAFERYDIHDPRVGLDAWMRRDGAEIALPELSDPGSNLTGTALGGSSAISVNNTQFPESSSMQNPVTAAVSTADGLSGQETGQILAFGKKSFADFTTAGWIQGMDNAAGVYKWLLGSESAYVDFGVSRANVLSFTVTSAPSASNAIFITANGNNSYPAVDIRRSVGSGSGLYIECASPSGYCLDLLQNSNTPALHIVSAASGSSAVPMQIEQRQATSTNYWEMAELRGSSTPTVAVSQWVGSTSPNGVLSGSAGDILQSSAGKLYICTGTTNWTELVGAGAAAAAAYWQCPANSATASYSAVDPREVQAIVAPDGADIYVAFHDDGVSSMSVDRYSYDTVTGVYVFVGTTTTDIDYSAANRQAGIFCGSTYVWVAGLNSGGTDIAINRYTRAMASETAITISGSALTAVGFVSGDDTHLYASQGTTSTTISVYTISGTTATRGSDFTLAVQGQYLRGLYFDGTDLLFWDANDDYKLKRYNVSGTLQATGSKAPAGILTDHTDIGYHAPFGTGFMKSGAVYCLSSASFDSTGAGTSNNGALIGVGITKP